MPWISHLPPVNLLTLEISFHWQLVCMFNITECTFFIVFSILYAKVFAYISTSHKTIILLLCLPYFHVFISAALLSSTTVLSISMEARFLLSVSLSLYLLTMDVRVCEWKYTRQPLYEHHCVAANSYDVVHRADEHLLYGLVFKDAELKLYQARSRR